MLAAKAQFEGDLELAADELRHLSDQRELNSKDRGWVLRLLIDSEKLDEAFIEAEAFVDEIPTDDLRQLILLGLEKHQLKAALPLQRSLFERHNEFQDGKEWLKSLLALNHWDEAQKLASSLKEKDEWESIHSDLTLSAQLKQLEGKWLSGSSSYQPLKADS